MTPELLAALHADAMTFPSAWRAKEFAEILTAPGVFLAPFPAQDEQTTGESARGAAPLSPPATPQAAQDLKGFALGRVTLDEAELLTIAVSPERRRQGIGRACLTAFEAEAQRRGAETAYLEVAASNIAALALYERAGWARHGTREGYYRAKDGRVDAILMRKHLRAD